MTRGAPLSRKIISRLLDTVGDGSGTKLATGDYSVTPEVFKIQPSEKQIMVITGFIVALTDTGSIDTGSYGNGLALTNGIQLGVFDQAGLVYTITDPDLPVRTNAEWAIYANSVSRTDFGQGDEWLVARFETSNIAGAGWSIVLKGGDGEFLAVTLNDDFSDLVTQYFAVQGYDAGEDAGY